MSKMGSFLPIEEYEQTATKCFDALRRGEYEETRKLLDILYESDFNRMVKLVRIRREMKKRGKEQIATTGEIFARNGYEKGLKKLDSMIESTRSRLDELLEYGLKSIDLQRG